MPGPASPAPDAPPAAAAATPTGCQQPDAPAELTQAVVAGTRIDGCFEPERSDDAYRFTVTGTGTQRVTMAIAGPAGDLSASFDLHDGKGGRITKSRATTNSQQPSATLAFTAEPGAVVTLVASASQAASPPRPYSVVISSAPDGDLDEPNDEPAQARPVSPGVRLEAFLTSRVSQATGKVIKDVDHYRLQISRAGELRVVAAGIAGARPRLQLLSASGKRLGGTESQGVAGEAVTLVRSVKPGDYVLAVEDTSIAGNPSELRSYHFTATTP
ncbi:MAG: hypothetical protein IT370_34880 [Deltaproteobacteria bacterium]|nr:hypothetical protein [Deltaproteobacteria bacterium]